MKKQFSLPDVSPLMIPVIAGVIVFSAMLIYGDGKAATYEPVPAPWPVLEPEADLPEPEADLPEPESIVDTCLIEERKLVLVPKINVEQAMLLEYAYNVAKADGHKEPSVLQGLIWQESHAGNFPGHEVAGDEYGLRVGKRYYGVGQIKVAAAKDVFKRFRADFSEFYHNKKYLKTDDEIIAYLIMDDKFNIRVASKYLWMMGQSTKPKTHYRPVNLAITAYNRGIGNAIGTDYDTWHYTVGVHKHKDTFIKTFNLANNIK
jgi:hypothetical protein